MSGIDDLCGCLAICCSCFAVSCNEASGLFCFYKCCSCRPRRNMNDTEFERTVEELYASGKDGDPHGPPHTHVLELQPRGGAGGKDADGSASVSAQPAPRASMEAPPPRRRSSEVNAEGERVPGEPRSERRERTREWVHAHSASEPGMGLGLGLDAPSSSRPRSRSRPRSKSQADGAARGEREAKASHTPGGSMRGQGAKGPSDAQAYIRSVEQGWKRSQEEGREGVDDPTDVPRREESVGGKREEGSPERTAAPPRLDIPASLRPGRPSSWTPSQLQFEPQTVGEPIGHTAGAS